MYTEVNDPIAVVGIYHQHQFSPKKFKWRQKIHKIDEVTLVSDVRDGQINKRLYSVVAAGNVYRLEFNRSSEQWQLLQVWVD